MNILGIVPIGKSKSRKLNRLNDASSLARKLRAEARANHCSPANCSVRLKG